jgi:hypothetical protein
MRRILSKIHTYGGLLSASYLIIFGVSSLNFNHHFSFAEPNDDFLLWEKTLGVTATEDRQAFAQSIRDDLGLMGWTPPWEFEEGEDGSFYFELVRPGKKYEITVQPSRHLAKVKETRLGFWPVLNHLHAMGSIPNSRFTGVWFYYTEICTFFVLFAAVSGVYFWAKRRDEKLIGWILLIGLSGGSLILMLYIWVRG